MSLRTRLLLAFAAVVLIPIALLAFGVRQEMSRRLSAEYQRRVDGVVEVIREDLGRESAGIDARLASLAGALVNDNQFRSAAVAGSETEREYLLDYAGTAMRLTGLSMLQIQDGDDRIISSGHFRNEHGRLEAGLVPAKEFLALARVQTLTIGGRRFAMVGGVAVDQAFLSRLARDRAIAVSLSVPGAAPMTLPNASAPAADSAVGSLTIPVIRGGSGPPPEVAQATLSVTQPLTPLRALVRSADSWFLFTAAGTSLTALLLAVWVSSRISGRLEALAEKTAVLDLDRLDVDFDPGNDEVGRLSRLLGDLVGRLRTSTTRIREAERRATIGELARQINHDVKNGLIPLRNVMRHLAQVERDEPETLAAVFTERRHTMDSSLAYLETLATTYQRLSPPVSRGECDLNALITDVVRAAQGHERATIDTDLVALPRVVGDPIAFRRILENLIANAVDALPSGSGRIVVSTRVIDRDNDVPAIRMAVSDSGPGMSAEESARIFEDFYTTKPGGTGLGLSIVRRLTTDLHGTIAVDTAPGRGTRITIDIPAGGPTRA
jgi:signal transduction histidine kinase